jgi:hypothetical protein
MIGPKEREGFAAGLDRHAAEEEHAPGGGVSESGRPVEERPRGFAYPPHFT